MKETVAVILEREIKIKLILLAASKNLKLAELLREILTNAVTEIVIPEKVEIPNKYGGPLGRHIEVQHLPIHSTSDEVIPKDYSDDIDPEALKPNEKTKWLNEFKG